MANADKVTSSGRRAVAIRKSITVARPRDIAFKMFMNMGEWWPKTHSYSRERAKDVVLEGRPGGRFFERYTDGEEFEIGRVVTYESPQRVVFSWKSPDWEAPTEVEVTFHAQGDRTRVDLVHSGWERIGTKVKHGAADFSTGWDPVLAAYAAYTAA